VHTAVDEGALKIHDRIRFRNPDYQRDTYYGIKDKSVIETTVGRVFFNEIWPPALGFYMNAAVPKKKLEELIFRCYQISGHEETVRVLDRLKALGFEHATRAGISIGLVDMIIPEEKATIIDAPASRSRGGCPVSQGHHHRRRALQQDRRHLDPRHRPYLEGDVQRPGVQRGPRRTSIRCSSWWIRAPAVTVSRSVSWPACAV
jgi:hypothetical protein